MIAERIELKPYDYNPIEIMGKTYYPIYRKFEDEQWECTQFSLDTGKTWRTMRTCLKNPKQLASA